MTIINQPNQDILDLNIGSELNLRLCRDYQPQGVIPMQTGSVYLRGTPAPGEDVKSWAARIAADARKGGGK